MINDITDDSCDSNVKLRGEIDRLNKIITVLMDRAERSTTIDNSSFNLFQTTVMLEEQVRQRTMEFEAALGKLRENEIKLRGLFDLSPLGIVLTDMKGYFVEFNNSFVRMLGYTADELKKTDYWTLTPEKFNTEEMIRLETLGSVGHFGPYLKEYIRKDGSTVPVQVNSLLVKTQSNQSAIWSIIEDITERKQKEQQLRIAATAFETQEGIVVTNPEGMILRVNRAFVDITGFTAEDMVGKNVALLRSDHVDAASYAEMWKCVHRQGAWKGEVWNRRKSGEIYPVWLTITAVKDDSATTTHYVVTLYDITLSKAAEEEIKHLAFFDPLTRLPNRRLLLDRLQQAVVASLRSRREGAVLFIDLDNFKLLNDTRGHGAGDLLLQQVALRLVESVRESDTVARLGGDEFVVLLQTLSEKNAEAVAQVKVVGRTILAALDRPYEIASKEHHSSASIGVALFSNNKHNVEEILKNADIAMYRAKAIGGNSLQFFS